MATGTVKFFNTAKGFGFIQPDDGGSDVFVHASAVEQAGLHGLNEGDQVQFELERDRKTGKLSAGQLVVTGQGAAPARRSGGFERRGGFGGGDRGGFGGGGRGGFGGERSFGRQPGEPAGSGSGTVKWFNPTKGFGFIQPEGGGEDVFVHISAVEQAGLRGLNEGQLVAYDLEQDRRSGKTSATNLRVMG
jgi:CspA family cold shock protein